MSVRRITKRGFPFCKREGGREGEREGEGREREGGREGSEL